MKKHLHIFTFFISIFGFIQNAKSQDYSLMIDTENPVFFINGNNYLRANRIDSIHIVDDVKTYFPFKSVRITDPSSTSSVALKKGNWMGEMVIEYDYLTSIPNIKNDTINILHKANLGEEWIFFNSGDSIIFQATVIAIDTMSVGAIFDTVKTIQINRINNVTDAIIVADSLNGFELKIAKNNGIIQAFDFYLFPYIFYGNLIPFMGDFLLVEMTKFECNHTSLLFKRIDSVKTLMTDYYDFEVGDTFHFKRKFKDYDHPASYSYFTIPIISKVETETSVIYEGLYTIMKSSIFTGTLLPEEWGVSNSFYYFDTDSSYCVRSALMTVTDWHLFKYSYDNYQSVEGNYSLNNSYKCKLGNIYVDKVEILWEWINTTEYLTYAIKNGIGCRPNNDSTPLSIHPSITGALHFTISPNPSTQTIQLSIYEHQKLDRLNIFDLTGKLMQSHFDFQSNKEIDISQLAPGLYILQIENNGKWGNQKFIKH